MKIIAIVEALLLIAAAVGGGLYYKNATATCESQHTAIAKGESDLASTKGDLLKTREELASTKATLATRTTELSQATTNLTSTSAELAQAKTTITSTATELAQAKSKVEETTKASDTASKQRDAVAGLLSRDAALQQLEAEVVSAHDNRYAKAVQAMETTPTATQFADLRKSIERLRDLLGRTEQAVNDAEGFIEANGAALASQLQTVEKVRGHVRTTGAEVAKSKATVERTLASLREVTFGVYANQGWQTSDLNAAEGEFIAISASGTWHWAVSIGNPVGPHGENGNAQYRVTEDLGNGALLARLHGSETIHPGFQGFEAERAGKVEFRINDEQVGDNSGTMNVTMWAFRPLE